jgi:hypothetical protein
VRPLGADDTRFFVFFFIMIYLCHAVIKRSSTIFILQNRTIRTLYNEYFVKIEKSALPYHQIIVPMLKSTETINVSPYYMINLNVFKTLNVIIDRLIVV